jgi:hypothetical protein
MNPIAVAFFSALILLPAASEGLPRKDFRGEIMDTQCARMGSHDVMMKKEAARNTGECARDCCKMGGKYVLYDPKTKTTYQLADQQKVEPFAGEKVTIRGSYDPSTNTINIVDLERPSSTHHSSRR